MKCQKVPESELKLVHATLTLRHGIVRAERERLGMTQREFGALARVRNTDICAVENMRWEQVCPQRLQRIAELCNVTVKTLIATSLAPTTPRQITSVAELDEQRLLAYDAEDHSVRERLMLPDPTTGAEHEELSEAIHEALAKLTDRERRTIIWRYGLDGEPPETLEAVGRRVRVSKEWVRSIEAKAIRKLQKVPCVWPLALAAFGTMRNGLKK